jgi:simple sugar transport system ATP-binding protein
VEVSTTESRGARAIRLHGIVKRYGTLVANDAVDFELLPGEIHALLGENGAGKTTMMSILFGLIPPDEGRITVDGEDVAFGSPHDALERGIGMVHQHFMLVPGFTVAENVVLGSEPASNFRFRKRVVERLVQEAAERHAMPIDAAARVRDLPIDTQQRVEILKLLYRGARTLILDEPTSSLGPAQIDGLFASLKDLRAQGCAIVMVTHKLAEVMEIADRVTVIRQGRITSVAARGSFDERSLARAMTGRELEGLPERSKRSSDKALLSVDGLVVHGERHQNVVDNVAFTAHAGEILGIAGVEGNGQRELVDALAGIEKVAGGSIRLDGADLTHVRPRERHTAGLGVIPEDRQGWGLVLDMTLAENLALADIPAGKYSVRGLVRWRGVRANAKALLEEYDVRPPNPDLRALALSGGNQQKVVLARELARRPKVLVAANPTHGLDVGATEYVRRRILEVREEGNAVVLVSQDLDELFELSDRILVLFRGRILYESAVAEVSMDELAMAMAGTAPSVERVDAS